MKFKRRCIIGTAIASMLFALPLASAANEEVVVFGDQFDEESSSVSETTSSNETNDESTNQSDSEYNSTNNTDDKSNNVTEDIDNDAKADDTTENSNNTDNNAGKTDNFENVTDIAVKVNVKQSDDNYSNYNIGENINFDSNNEDNSDVNNSQNNNDATNENASHENIETDDNFNATNDNVTHENTEIDNSFNLTNENITHENTEMDNSFNTTNDDASHENIETDDSFDSTGDNVITDNIETNNNNNSTNDNVTDKNEETSQKNDDNNKNTKELKKQKARFVKLTADDTYDYYLDRNAVRWINMPYSTTEYMADVWIRMIEKKPNNDDMPSDMHDYLNNDIDDEISEAAEKGIAYDDVDVKVLRTKKYFLEHYYMRPKTQQIQFLCELEVIGRPQNSISERAYDYKNWENLIPGSIEFALYHGVMSNIGTSKASKRGHMSVADMVEEYGRISIR